METAEYSLLFVVMESHTGWYQNRQKKYVHEIFSFEWRKKKKSSQSIQFQEHKYYTSMDKAKSKT
jgi:hypothetical protein